MRVHLEQEFAQGNKDTIQSKQEKSIIPKAYFANKWSDLLPCLRV